MPIAVIAFNFCLSAANFYLAWRFWNLGRGAAEWADRLSAIERHLPQLLTSLPTAILEGQQQAHQLRNSYRQLARQRQQLAQLAAALRFLLVLWQRRRRHF